MSFELIYPGIRSHLGCPQQDLVPKYKWFKILCFESLIIILDIEKLDFSDNIFEQEYFAYYFRERFKIL